MVGLAAFVEEPAKLVPLAVVAVLAPGRVRRLAAVDWALVGFALGAGFTAAEEGVRRFRTPGMLGETRFSYSLNPWGSGSYSMPLSDAVSVGHQVRTMIVAAGVGLAIALWRKRGWARIGAMALPGLLLAWVIADHAGWNAMVTWRSTVHSSSPLKDWASDCIVGVPGWIALPWILDLWWAEVPVAVALFGVCQLVDASRRAWPGLRGWTLLVAASARYPRLRWAPTWLRPVVVGALVWAGYVRSDLALTWSIRRRHRCAWGGW